MPTEIYLVKVGMNMTEGVVEEWYIPDGGTVSRGQLLYRLETEKVNLDVDAEASGTVRHLVAEGVTMAPGDVIGYLYAADEPIPENPAAVATAKQTQPDTGPASYDSRASAGARVTSPPTAEGRLRTSPIARRLAIESNIDLTRLTGTGPSGRIVEADVRRAALDVRRAALDVRRPAPDPAEGSILRSSPMARKLARELGIDLSSVTGSGPGGRIIREDVEAARLTPAAAAADARRPDTLVPVKGMRRTIARRMQESLQSMAQLTMDMDVVMDDAIRLRAQLIEEWADRGLRPTYSDLVIRATAKVLGKHPHMNASLNDDELVLHGAINIGMAVALEAGLIVPVVHNADALSMETLSRETARLADAAREGRLTIEELQGGTFTITALGMYGVDSFTPIINAPQAGILGVNRIREDIAWEGDRPIKQHRMRLSLTWDHRVLDGAPAARFLSAVKDLLESPYRLLI